MTTILETKKLTKSFGKRKVVDSICLHVPEKSIYGFLGPNGAGKTTTIRIILGLIEANKGEVAIFGQRLRKHRADILQQVGSLVENPSVYSHMTGYENMKVACMHYGIPVTRIEETLELVNIKDRMNDKAGSYSLGMKQRLALALALVHRPKLLILDEPTNGLDPSGIKEMRSFLKNLPAKIGTTVFLSSHMLNEVEQICDHVGIINQGKLLFEGTMQELQGKSKDKIMFKVSDAGKAHQIIKEYPVDKSDGDRIYFSNLSEAKIAQINKLLISKGIDVFEIRKEGQNLEDMFFEITGGAAV